MLEWGWAKKAAGAWFWSGGGGAGGGGGRWHVGVAMGVTAIALAATLVISSRRGSLKSPWSRGKRKHTLTKKQWKSFFTPERKLRDGGAKLLKKVRSGGIDPSIRAEVWPFLLGVYDLSSTEAERQEIRTERRKEYEKLRRRCRRLLKHADEGNNEKEGIDEVSNVESPNFNEGPESTGFEDVSCAKPSLSIEEEGSVNSYKDHTGISHGKHEGGKTETDVNAPAEEEGPESTGFEDVSCARPSLSIEEEGLVNSVKDHTGISHGKQEGCKAETDCVDAPAEEVDSGITHVDGSSVDSESSGAPSSEGETEVGNTEINPQNSKNTHLNEDIPKPKKTTEDFDTWQRIIRLDAIRANAEWVIYSPTQAAVSEEKALQCAASVGLKDFDHLEPCRIHHASRLVAILEAYAIYDQEIGYCQGMSDLLSPILAVIEDDGEAFWCFVGFMSKARHNFRLDEVGIRRQLNIVSKIIKTKDSNLYKHLEKLQAEDCFFVYRMVVVLFRRELDFEQTLCLWEVMWADQAAIRSGIGKSAWGRIRLGAPPTEDLLLYAIAACVLQMRKLIIESYSSMDEIIRECNSMAGNLDVWKLLDNAHDLVVTVHNKI